MLGSALVLLWVASAGPATDRYLMRLGDAPAGVVTLSLGEEYVYRSQQLFPSRARGERWVRREERVRVDKQGREAQSGLFLESLSLWKRPAWSGCREAREELGPRRGSLCVQEARGPSIRGTVFGEAFSARYLDGILEELEIGPARFTRMDPGSSVELAGPQLLEAGLPVQGERGPLQLQPAVSRHPECKLPSAAVRLDALRRAVRLRVTGEMTCLDIARLSARVARERGLRVGIVHGMVLDGERVFPHAWTRLPDGSEFDFTRDAPATTATHLAIGCTEDDKSAEVGRVWLELLAHPHRVLRAK